MKNGLARGSAIPVGQVAKHPFHNDRQSPDTFLDPVDPNTGYGQAETLVATVPGNEMTAGCEDDSVFLALREQGKAR
jgi:hypothetical protein